MSASHRIPPTFPSNILLSSQNTQQISPTSIPKLLMTSEFQVVNVQPSIPASTALPKKATLYILELEHDCYYVGITHNFERRFQAHTNGTGATWCKMHKPIRVKFAWSIESERAKVEEGKLTARLIQRHGINHVRGGHLTSRWPYEGKLLLWMLRSVCKNLVRQGRLALRCVKCGLEGHTFDVCAMFEADGKLVCRERVFGEGGKADVRDGALEKGLENEVCEVSLEDRVSKVSLEDDVLMVGLEDEVLEVAIQGSSQDGREGDEVFEVAGKEKGFLLVWDCDASQLNEEVVIMD